MTTQAPTRETAPPTATSSADTVPTHPADAPTVALSPSVAALQRQALDALDHRGRRRLVRRAHATPGPHLALDGAGQALLPLDQRLIQIGREAAADLRLEDTRVSRRHAIVVRYGDHVRLLDDRSLAGTFVNHERVIATDLRDGDVIRLGPVSLTYVLVT